MRNRLSLVIFLLGALLFSLPAAAQVYYSGGRSEAQKKAADESKTSLKYDPHDLSGVWSGVAVSGAGKPLTNSKLNFTLNDSVLEVIHLPLQASTWS
jgi:hypothetical protein